MAYKELKGNIFNTKAQTVVNTVNCIGAMGKGIALEFKLRFPEMFQEYQSICEKRLLRPGQIWPYRKGSPWVLNFAIKDDWHQPSKVEWVEETLKKFSETYRQLGIKSIAFPWMGAMNGGIPFETIQELTRKYLGKIEDIDIEVYDFDPNVTDPLFDKLVFIMSQPKVDFIELFKKSEIQAHTWKKIYEVMKNDNVISLYRLIKYEIDGKTLIGKTNIEKLYHFLTKYQPDKNKPIELTLF